jgi:hypothetical protein
MVRHAAWAGHDFMVEPVIQFVGRLPQTRSGSQLDLGGDRHVEGVYQVGVEELPDRRRPAAEPYILALRGRPGLLEDGGGVTVDEVECGVGQGE